MRVRERRGRPLVIGLLVFVWAFGVYGFTMGALVGYEPETAAVTEGFVRTGHFQVLRHSPLRSEGHLGRGGRLVGRAGLPQPLLVAPFDATGWAIDGLVVVDDDYAARRVAVLFYNPFAMALAAALVFGIVLTATGSLGWGAVMGMLFAVASLAWPYSKMGMETTLTLAMALFVLAALRAGRGGSKGWWALVGFAAGMAFAVKPYTAPVLLPALAVLLPPLRALPGRRRLGLLAVTIVPLVAWLVAVGWYNHAREGSILDFGNAAYNFTWAAPFNTIGYLVSPGKGLVFYSPLVVLGLLGLRRLAREDRRLATMLGGMFALGVLVVSGTKFWGDETWGPRYIVNVAWIPLVTVPWWCRDLVKRRILAATAVVAACVQIVAIAAPYWVYLLSTKELTGLPIYQPDKPADRQFVTDIPFGDDPPRWIPQVSPLLFQTALVTSHVVDALGGGSLTYTYSPHEGLRRRVDLSRHEKNIPDFWWRYAIIDSGVAGSLALGSILIAGLGWLGLRRYVVRGRSPLRA
jgi:hypothetical protein